MVAVYFVFAALGVAAIRLDAPRMVLVVAIAVILAFVHALLIDQSTLAALATTLVALAAFQISYVIGIVLAAVLRRQEPRLAA